MNITIIGFRSTGKSTISKLLARKLDKKLISIDNELLKRTKNNAKKYIKTYGLNKFQELETEVIEKLSDFDDCIFDTNYSIVMRNENIINLKKGSLIILLTADVKTIAERLKNKEKDLDIRTLLQEYEPRYNNAADYAIDTSRLSPEEICDLIVHYTRLEIQ